MDHFKNVALRHGSLESGIGMFDYAADQMGWENVFHCEINPFCRTVLNYYWPKAKSYANVFGFDGNIWRGKVDIITAGFPCQPFSTAGERKGSKDDRHIWPENMRIFREAQPTFILCENVPGLLSIENGMVFEAVCLDLENEGYEVQTYIIPACATDKDHRRDRLWIVAYSESNGNCKQSGTYFRENSSESQHEQEGGKVWNKIDAGFITNPDAEGVRLQGGDIIRGSEGVLSEGLLSKSFRTHCITNDANPLSQGLQRHKQRRTFEQGAWASQPVAELIKNENWLEAATRLCSVDDGLPGELDTTSISKSKWRIESLKAYGNTIVWEIAYNIFKAIELTNEQL